MNYLMMSRYAICALILVLSMVSLIGTGLVLMLYTGRLEYRASKPWTWGTPESRGGDRNE